MGTMVYASGDVYEGMWAQDDKHGQGSYFYSLKGKRYISSAAHPIPYLSLRPSLYKNVDGDHLLCS
jgi:hypothetical protein